MKFFNINLNKPCNKMKILLSINYKFNEIRPDLLIEKIKKSKIKGMELAINKELDKSYILELINLCKLNNLIFQIHAPNLENEEEKKDFLNNISTYQKEYGKRLNIVIHPLSNIESTIELTNEFNYNNKIVYTLENLNKLNNIKRLAKEDIEKILKINKNLKFTYDIGHELIDSKKVKINNFLLTRLHNVHLHYYKNSDHYPIEKNDLINFKNILFKLNKKYKKSVYVAEYSIDYIEGENINIKLDNYIRKAELLYELERSEEK